MRFSPIKTAQTLNLKIDHDNTITTVECLSCHHKWLFDRLDTMVHSKAVIDILRDHARSNPKCIVFKPLRDY